MIGRIGCIGCQASSVELVLDLGPQPPSNRFVAATARDEDRHSLAVGVCETCGLMQLIGPMSVDMVRPRVSWLSYQEPESHLDDVVARLCQLPKLSAATRIRGLTYKDDSTLARFAKRGLTSISRFDLMRDFGITEAGAGLETIQRRLDSNLTQRLAEQHGRAGLVIVRHVIEHAHDPLSFLRALGCLVEPDGYLVLEAPDLTKFVASADYSFLWEEHISYFSTNSLAALVATACWSVVETIICPFAFEDSIIVVLKRAGSPGAINRQRAVNEVTAIREFAERFPSMRSKWRTQLASWHASGKRIAVFGAGHLAAKFINFFDLGGYIEAVIDDNPNKLGLTMPGSRLPIVSSTTLASVDICLLSLSPESEQKVIAKHSAFTARGGQFGSIFPSSRLAPWKDG